MSELAKTLELFGFLSIDDVTLDSLKKSFKTRILEVHPDKGGNADLFDKMLSSYVYLTETVQRISGGRATLQNILSPDELKRSDEIINQFFEEFQNDEFNRQFEIHPEAMAICSNFGTALIENENCYTSDIYSNPEYTDLYSAYTLNNIICDKIDLKQNPKSINFDDIIAERNKEITPVNDEELKAIRDFEKKKLEDDIKGFNNKSNTLENWQPTTQIEEYKNFVIHL